MLSVTISIFWRQICISIITKNKSIMFRRPVDLDPTRRTTCVNAELQCNDTLRFGFDKALQFSSNPESKISRATCAEDDGPKYRENLGPRGVRSHILENVNDAGAYYPSHSDNCKRHDQHAKRSLSGFVFLNASNRFYNAGRQLNVVSFCGGPNFECFCWFPRDFSGLAFRHSDSQCL